MVTKLQLDWRSTTEGFRKLIISVTETFLIRRIVGTTANYEEIQFDFEDIRLNQNLPEARFDYEAPASANMFPNFLFEQES
jgi:outer membrane lipoprotein-sorting protein